jgi:hypothetical protein
MIECLEDLPYRRTFLKLDRRSQVPSIMSTIYLLKMGLSSSWFKIFLQTTKFDDQLGIFPDDGMNLSDLKMSRFLYFAQCAQSSKPFPIP